VSASGYEPPFAREEYARRISLTRRRMAERGLDLLVCQDPANMCWLTGFDSWSFYTPQAVVLHLDDDWPYWFGRAQDARSAAMTTVLPADRIVAYSEPLVHHPERHPFDELCELVRARGWQRATVGVELDAPK
jgi:Xaa-Pro aminopeptidase